MSFQGVQARTWLREALCFRHLPNRIFFAIVIAHIASSHRDLLQPSPLNPANVSAEEPCEPPPSIKHGDPLSILYDTISKDWARQYPENIIKEEGAFEVVVELPGHPLWYLCTSLGFFLATWIPLAFNPWARQSPSVFSFGTVFLITWALCCTAAICTGTIKGNRHVATTIAIHTSMFLMDSYLHVCALYPFSGYKLRNYSLAMPLVAQFVLLGMVFQLEENAPSSLPFHEHVAALALLELLRATAFPLVCTVFADDNGDDVHHDKAD